jgi:hypothetical protein
LRRVRFGLIGLALLLQLALLPLLLVLLLFLNERSILLDLLLEFENLNIYRRQLFPQFFILKDLLINLLANFLLPGQIVFIGEQHFEEGLERSEIIGVQFHAEVVEGIISPFIAISQIFKVALQELYIGAGGQLQVLESHHNFEGKFLNVLIFIVNLSFIHLGE